ncbi:MAG TPA: hypothetical protein VFV10_04925 [Gammaproteobacteria bacterium]|nr:hypothetical protein [Gammaproteobacteria bacterium]
MTAAVPFRWHRSPILWLGAALFAASMLACILTVLLSLRHADPSLEVGGAPLLDVPIVEPSGERE